MTDEPELSYEQKSERLEDILMRLDDSKTPIDELAEDVKEGVRLIKELDAKLNSVKTEVRDAFKDLDEVTSDEKEGETA